jgi:hypothetical protein
MHILTNQQMQILCVLHRATYSWTLISNVFPQERYAAIKEQQMLEWDLNGPESPPTPFQQPNPEQTQT